VTNTPVLIVGAGPVGLTAAVELRRRGIDATVIDRLTEPARYAKAVGIQPRTLEVWDAMGIARSALDVSAPMLGQIVFVDGREAMRIDLELPDDVPYRFACIPQYATEDVLARALTDLGGTVRRGVELTSFTEGADGVVATLRDADGSWECTTEYLVGCDGAHSAVRKGLGVSFDGDAFPEEYMLADVELGWSLPAGYGIRSMTTSDGATTDLMVCIPLPGRGRYRVSSFVAPDLATPPSERGIAHRMEAEHRPTLAHIQALADRLAPEPTRVSALRWSSVFRISHRIVGSYGTGRVFVAGDAAHIHPPTGAQGMNTGIQDAYDLCWKLALAVTGRAADGLLASYDAERRPIGEEVVGRTVRDAREGIGAGENDPTTIMLREAQLLLGYRGSPIVDDAVAGSGPSAGDRAPDARGLRQAPVAVPTRLHDLLRHPGHTVILWSSDPGDVDAADDLADTLIERAGDLLRAYVLTPAGVAGASGRRFEDDCGRAAATYGFGAAAEAVVVRPDGYLAFRTTNPTADALLTHLGRVLRL